MVKTLPFLVIMLKQERSGMEGFVYGCIWSCRLGKDSCSPTDRRLVCLCLLYLELHVSWILQLTRKRDFCLDSTDILCTVFVSKLSYMLLLFLQSLEWDSGKSYQCHVASDGSYTFKVNSTLQLLSLVLMHFFCKLLLHILSLVSFALTRFYLYLWIHCFLRALFLSLLEHTCTRSWVMIMFWLSNLRMSRKTRQLVVMTLSLHTKWLPGMVSWLGYVVISFLVGLSPSLEYHSCHCTYNNFFHCSNVLLHSLQRWWKRS